MTAAERAARREELRREYRDRKARELEADGDAEAAAELREGRCACRCGQRLDGLGVRSFYIDQRHRQTAHRRRLERAAEAAGLPPRLSLQTLQAQDRTRDRNGDAPARRPRRKSGPRPGVTVYLPSVLAAELTLERLEAELVEEPETDPHAVELDAARAAVEAALARRRSRA